MRRFKLLSRVLRWWTARTLTPTSAEPIARAETLLNEDQTKLLMATVEVLGQAVRLILAEQILAHPADKHQELLKVLEAALSTVPEVEQALTSPVFISHSPLSEWMPIAAAQLVDGVRSQIADCVEVVPVEVSPPTPSRTAAEL
jgi:hypothetical protein